ncbi:MAG: radical SAM protein [Myxococcota bacterium]
MPTPLDHRALYRLPWSLSDNTIAWLEPTAKCNLACEGCYRENINSHKPMDEVRRELDVFEKWRTFDGVSIAGGDPLLHPNVVDIVAEVARRGHKPVLNTNGLALTKDLLVALKKAGLVGLTFHIDSKQGRPGWKNKTELELCELRLQLAELVHEVGDLALAFNSTVYEDTLKYVPELVSWAEQHMDKVHVMVFITYRNALTDGPYEFFCQGKKVDVGNVQYAVDEKTQRADITSREVVATIQQRFPDFAPSAYLGGTEKADSLKWLLTTRIGMPGKTFGYVGPRFHEAVQAIHHLVKGTYLAYSSPQVLSLGRSLLALSPLEAGLARTRNEYLKHLVRHPLDVRKKLLLQTIACIQPIDFTESGRQNMCDGCPDITVHGDELVWSCRLDEKQKFGDWVQTVPKHAVKKPAAA